MWEQVKSNQTRSTVLIAAMAVLLLLLGYFIGWYFFNNGIIGLFIAFVIWAIMSLVAYFQSDSMLIAMSGGIKISRDDYPQLYNVVEEMKIASGLEAMPNIYIIYDQALNAFATGTRPDKASVAITSGLLQKLNRDELQGVIGHELAHIKNRDVLLMSICSVMLGIIVILSSYARWFFVFGRGPRLRVGKPAMTGRFHIVVLVASLILVILAPVVARLIYFAISRKREYLADASSALYTRYPEGLASALEKISRSGWLLMSANKTTASMYIVNPYFLKDVTAGKLTDTHPPISERVGILRAMGGGASYGDYDKAYRQVHSAGTGIMSDGAIYMAGEVVARQASPTDNTKTTSEKISRTREVSDVMLRLNKYKITVCDCGATWKIPQDFKDDTVLCTRCGNRIKVH